MCIQGVGGTHEKDVREADEFAFITQKHASRNMQFYR